MSFRLSSPPINRGQEGDIIALQIAANSVTNKRHSRIVDGYEVRRRQTVTRKREGERVPCDSISALTLNHLHALKCGEHKHSFWKETILELVM